VGVVLEREVGAIDHRPDRPGSVESGAAGDGDGGARSQKVPIRVEDRRQEGRGGGRGDGGDIVVPYRIGDGDGDHAVGDQGGHVIAGPAVGDDDALDGAVAIDIGDGGGAATLAVGRRDDHFRGVGPREGGRGGGDERDGAGRGGDGGGGRAA